MSKATTLLYMVLSLRRTLEPAPKPVRILPSVFLDTDGEDWPGYETHNERSRRYVQARGIMMKEYTGFDPANDGSEL